MNQNKEISERLYLKILKEYVADIPEEEPTKTEAPDFIWPNLTQPLGIEFTRLFKNPPLGRRPQQIQEAEEGNVVQLACQIYKQKVLPRVDVHVLFGNIEIKKKDRQNLAEQIAETVERHLPLKDTWIGLDSHSAGNLLPYGIAYISIARLEGITRNFWSVSGGGWVQEDFVDELQKTINVKNAEFRKYLGQCSECWLIVVADAGGGSSLFEANDNTRKHQYFSLFHRTFFIELFKGNVFELNTKLPGI